MLHDIDKAKLTRLMDENPDVNKIISQLLENHNYIVSKISHEIRNPLTLIYSTLQLLEKQHPDLKDYRHWTQTLLDVQSMAQLLTELSTYNNGDNLNKSQFSSVDFFKTIIISFAIALENTSIEFSSYIDPALPKITGDKTKLQQIFLNLLRNAYDAVGESGHILLKVIQPDDSNLMIEVTDDGCGIDTHQIEHIFDAFTTYKKNGTGLGLAISKRIVEAHRGTIAATSTLGNGTTFTVRLPIE